MNPNPYDVEPPRIPDEDRSGEIGQRLLRLMSGQARKSLLWMEEERRSSGAETGTFLIPGMEGHRWPRHVIYHATGSACLFATLARFGDSDRTMAGTTREGLEDAALILIRASAKSHPASGSAVARPDLWSRFASIRILHVLSLGAWLLWDRAEAETRLLVARLLEYEADRFLGEPVPTQMFYDTQAESNAWFGGGLATAFCMLKAHPRRDLWQEKAKEMMTSAYATERDVNSERVVDGRPLRQWLSGPNAFPDYTVENHGFVHADYMTAISEKVRSAISYRLAGEPVPEAVTFNAMQVLDALMRLSLPDGNPLYVQGSDYTSRRMDAIFQAYNLTPLAPDPLRQAGFLRSLDRLEQMAADRPDALTSGCLAFPFDLGFQWGLVENYLMRRLFGDGGDALPDAEIETRLAGVHVSEFGRFAIHRTPKTLSSFSWHAACKRPNLMGLTTPLDPDVMVSPLPVGGYIGEVREEGMDPDAPVLVWSRVHPREDGFGAMIGLDRCGGKVRQNSAFLSLPDGASVYLEERTALREVEIDLTESGNVSLYDDTRWPFQKTSRVFHGDGGALDPAISPNGTGSWVNVDDRLGFVAPGSDGFAFRRVEEETDYHRWRLAFVGGSGAFSAGQGIGAFALVTCPGQRREETKALAGALGGWLLREPGALALRVGPRIAYAVFGPRHHRFQAEGRFVELAPQRAGWV